MLEIKVSNAEVQQVLGQLLRRMGNLQPVMKAIGQEMESRVSGRFETETDPNGISWAPWAQSTKDAYPVDGNGRILDRYGDMLSSLSWQASQSSVLVGFGEVYATYHEFGTDTMPRHGLLSDDPATGTLAKPDERAVLDILGNYFAA